MSRELEVVRPRERYVLLERLGRGGAGETWRARREGGLVAQEVCVKRPLGSPGAAERRALLEEARVLGRVRHANVVSLLDLVEDASGRLFLVLELVDGLDLRQLTTFLERRGESLSPNAVAVIGARLGRALAAAQRALPGGLVHRDVTPHNVLVSSEGEIKLADFGVARASDRERWTRTGLVKGKLAYVSPEQLRGERLDVRSDLFALGILLYELLSGRRPFPGRRAGSTLGAIANDDRVPLGPLPPDAPSTLGRMVEQMLSHEPDDRPASADLAARLLGQGCNEQAATDELRRFVRAARGPGVRCAFRPADAAAIAGAGI